MPKIKAPPVEYILIQDANFLSVYRTANYVERGVKTRFMIPITPDKMNTYKCKLVNLDSEGNKIDMSYMWFAENYRLLEVDIEHDIEWLAVKQIEAERKLKREQELLGITPTQDTVVEAPVKRKRGRPKKIR